MSRKAWARWLELAAMFVFLPAVIGYGVPPPWWIPCLWAIAALANWRLGREEGTKPRPFWAPIDWERVKPELVRIGLRFAGAAGLLVLALIVAMPERLFDFPREHTVLWLLIVALYPALSVYPQELLYRRYFFHRFRDLFGPTRLMVASALAFAWMHLIFRNGFAVGMTLIGGILFADTYRRTGSLRLVCLEHALYGVMVFTIGLGQFIYHGAVRG
jgi:membrane protease YdiL (CAAX protease family)